MNVIRHNIILFAISWGIIFGCEPKQEADLVLSNANIIHVEDGSLSQAQDVYIRGNKIVRIANHKTDISYRSKEAFDCTGKYLIPGLWDMHTHATYDFAYQYALPLLAANGITGIREMWGSLKLVDSLREVGSVQDLPIPRIVIPGYILDGDPAWNGAAVATPEEAIEYVNILHEHGADFVKPYSMLLPEVYDAIAQRAHELELPLYGHEPILLGGQYAAKKGQQSIEHYLDILLWCNQHTEKFSGDWKAAWYGDGIPMTSGEILDSAMFYFEETKAVELAKTYQRNHTWLCPTLIVEELLIYAFKDVYKQDPNLKYVGPRFKTGRKRRENGTKRSFERDSTRLVREFELRKQVLKIMIEEGVSMVAGTDAGISLYGFDLHKELALFVDLGMKPIDALRTATLNPAKLLGKEKELGTIAKNKMADILILHANPLEDILHTQNIAGVVLNGKLVARQKIDECLQSIETRFAKKTILDTLATIYKTHDLQATLDVYDTLAQSHAKAYLLDDFQLIRLAQQIKGKGNKEDAIQVLKKNIQENPSELWRTYINIAETFEELSQTDSAIRYYEKVLDYYGPTELHARSRIRRLKDPTYGKPSFQSLDKGTAKKYLGKYVNEENEIIEINWENDQLNLGGALGEFDLLYRGEDTFHLKGNSPDRIIFKHTSDHQRLMYVAYRSTTVFTKK